MFIGLTGQIGAGKSSVAAILQKHGAVIVDADQIGRDLLEQNATLKRRLVQSFGQGILDHRGKIDRRALALAAFKSETSRQTLNQIVHPRLLKELGRQVKLGNHTKQIVVIDAALLLEWGLDKKVDLVLAVRAPREIRLRRMINKGFTRTDILRRMRRQMTWKEFDQKADVVVSNAGSKAELRRAITFLWKRISPLK
jgi:dephospho-CoA kinase